MKNLNLGLWLLAVGLYSCAPANTPAETTADAPAEAKAVFTSGAPADYTDGLQIGEKAPDFRLQNIDGNMYGLDDVKDANGAAPKGYIVTFTCNTCPFAVAYEDRLVALHQKASAMGYPVVAIQPNDVTVKPGDNLDAMKVRAQEKGFGFLYLLDADQSIYPQYGASRTPEIYLLDANRVLRYHGAIDDNAQDASAVTVNYVEKAIAALEAGQDPNPADVKAIGCTIKTR